MPQVFPSKEFVRVGPARSTSVHSSLDLQVIFTDLARTRATLSAVAQYASGLGAQITLLAAQVVPYPLPLDRPPVPVEFTESTLRSLASEQAVATTVEIYLCRDKTETLRHVLKPESLIVIGGRKRWWPTAENHLARQLRRDGHRVIFGSQTFA